MTSSLETSTLKEKKVSRQDQSCFERKDCRIQVDDQNSFRASTEKKEETRHQKEFRCSRNLLNCVRLILRFMTIESSRQLLHHFFRTDVFVIQVSLYLFLMSLHLFIPSIVLSNNHFIPCVTFLLQSLIHSCYTTVVQVCRIHHQTSHIAV